MIADAELNAYWFELEEDSNPYLIIAKTYKEAVDYFTSKNFSSIEKGERLSDSTDITEEYYILVVGMKE